MKRKPHYMLLFAALLCIHSAAYATALDDYIAQPNPSYSWTEVDSRIQWLLIFPITISHTLELTSQAWRNDTEVAPNVWTHSMTVTKPYGGAGNTAMILINGGDIGDPPPSIDPADPNNAQFRNLAYATGSMIVELTGVPNQPLVFSDEDPNSRSEDEIIAYSWDKFLNGGDDFWPVQLPMVQSVVACMDAIQEFDSGIEYFVLTGGSKRGWTAWLTAAVDDRVVAIAPIVSDLLNMRRSFAHHWSCYGFWADALEPYEELGIFDWFDTPRADELVDIVDPYAYLADLTIPKFIVTAAGDDFFVHDSAQFYIDGLIGETYLRTVPNTNHYLDGAFQQVFENMVPYYDAFLRDEDRPFFSWSLEEDGSMLVFTDPNTALLGVNLWQADNLTGRDFRQVTIGPSWTIEPNALSELAPNVYLADPGNPPIGWRSYFVEVIYDYTTDSTGISDFDYHFTTEMRVLPEMRPYEADWTRDGLTDLADVSVLGARWLTDTPYYDVMPRRTGDGIINLQEMSVFSLHWLESQ